MSKSDLDVLHQTISDTQSNICQAVIVKKGKLIYADTWTGYSMPVITPNVCQHTYCLNMAKSGMNLKVQKSLKSPVISRVFRFEDGVTTPMLHQ